MTYFAIRHLFFSHKLHKFYKFYPDLFFLDRMTEKHIFSFHNGLVFTL